ncbi:MAG: hypothetical protein IT383_09425 [Deltaproteobacteria bacterium]|nr:hypothetical protein [Deltaproteobacteria bacterium]
MKLHFLPVLSLVALSSACIFVAPPPHDPYGDLSFDWSFAGISSCDDAGVDEVDLTLLQAGEVVLVIEREPCVGGGLTITELREGTYEVAIDAFSRESVPLYAGSFVARVVGGEATYAGVVELDALGEPPPADGALGMFWGFNYPTDGALTFDCATAGVEDIDVLITPHGGAGMAYDDTFACEDEGAFVERLPPGRYTVQLLAIGAYHNDDLLLYDSGEMIVDVLDGSIVELGDVELARVETAFSDFDVAWTFAAASCESTGVEEVLISFTRFGFAAPEDSFAVDCSATSVLRRTFVPGSYTVTASAQGNSDDFLAQVTVDLAPDSVAQIDLVLAP